MIFDYAQVRDQLDRAHHGLSEPRRVTLILGGGDAAWNPASTKRLIHGPATVRYTEYSDGGIDAEVTA